MRLLLALLVGLAQVAGPWLCCCVSARAAVPAAAAPAETCPHCQSKSEPPAEPAPGLPVPCPCGGKVVEPVVPAKADTLDALTPDLQATAAFDSTLPRPVVPAASAAGVNPLPFLPPGTRLYVHHALRC